MTAPRSKLLFYVVTSAAVVVGVWFRLTDLGRSLWLDEAWVANSVSVEPLASGISDGWVQTTPPLFLAMVAFVGELFGRSEVSLRMVPLSAGVASIALSVLVARQILRPGYAALLVLAVAVSPILVVFAKTLKQFSTDCFAALVLLFLTFRYLSAPSVRLLLIAGMMVPLLLALSYTTALFLPALCLAAIVVRREGSPEGGWQRFGPGALLSGWALAWCGLVYSVFAAPNRTGGLVSYWSHGFASGGVLQWIEFQHDFARELADASLILIRAPLDLAAVALGLLGLLYLLLRSRGPLPRTAALVLALPIVSLLVLNGARLLPYQERVLLGIVPVFLTLFVSGIEASGEGVRWILDRLGSARAPDFGWLAATAFALLVLVRISAVSPSPFLERQPEENVRSAVAYLHSVSDRADVVYIHGSMWHPFRYYAERFGTPAGELIVGRTSWPCCRLIERDRGDPTPSVQADAARLLTSTRQTVRLLFTDRAAHWTDLVPDDRVALASSLTQAGCLLVRSSRFRGVRIDEYQCGPEASRPACGQDRCDTPKRA